jgi:hypothetical protein
MMTNEELVRELRRARRRAISADLRDRVLAAAESVPTVGLPDLRTSGPARFVSFRFAVVAVALAAVVSAGLWNVRQTPPVASPGALADRHTKITGPPGDDVVVFWLDDETPVLVSLADKR